MSLPNYQLDPPEPKRSALDVWLEAKDHIDNIMLIMRDGPNLRTISAVSYEAEELNEKIRLLKEGM